MVSSWELLPGAIVGVDNALWDLKGKLLNQPVYNKQLHIPHRILQQLFPCFFLIISGLIPRGSASETRVRGSAPGFIPLIII
jgi:hypothetical protein